MARTHNGIKYRKRNSSCLLNVNSERKTSGLERHLAAEKAFLSKIQLRSWKWDTLLKRQHLTHEPTFALRQDTDEAVPMDKHQQKIKLRSHRVKLSKATFLGVWKNLSERYSTISTAAASGQIAQKQTKSIVIRNIFKVKDEIECFSKGTDAWVCTDLWNGK